MTPSEIAESIDHYCNTAVAYAQSFGKHLDYSDDSVGDVEQILDFYHRDLARSEEKPTLNQIWSMAVVWGAYLGEVMRRKIGEPCGWIFEDGELLLEAAGAKANPMGKAYKRIVNGPEDNVVSFFDIIGFHMKRHIDEMAEP
jgi:hypothetical protein